MMTVSSLLFFFNDTATTEIYTLSLHDALPISCRCAPEPTGTGCMPRVSSGEKRGGGTRRNHRSEEHTSELQSQSNIVCRLLLEKKKVRDGTSRGKGSGTRRLIVSTAASSRTAWAEESATATALITPSGRMTISTWTVPLSPRRRAVRG